MSGWWSLPQAAPVLLRHLSAYAELAEQDLAVARRQIGARLIAIAFILVAGLFALLMICAAVIATTWDTPHRMTAIYGMLAVFAATLLIALGYLARVNGPSETLFAAVKGEWALDRVVLDQLLSEQRARAAADANHPEDRDV